jgi:hypothetical protein
MPAFLFGSILDAIDAFQILNHGAASCGRDWIFSSAEGATAPETLRQKDRSTLQLWKADRH